MARILFLVVVGLLLSWPGSSPAQDEFEVWEEDTSTEELVIVSECDPTTCEPGRLQRILVIGSLLATAGAGFLIEAGGAQAPPDLPFDGSGHTRICLGRMSLPDHGMHQPGTLLHRSHNYSGFLLSGFLSWSF